MSTTTSFPRMHVSLYVAYIESTIRFYDSFFAQPASKVQPGYAKYELSQPGLIISFVENAEKPQPQFGHLGIQVGSEADLTRALEAAREHNLPVREEMGTNCCYARQDKFWARDPDGHQWEVYMFHEDVEFNDPHYAGEDTAACCAPAQRSRPAKQTVKLVDLRKQTVESCDPADGCC